MKKVLCLILCLMLMLSAVGAETADTLPRLLARQMTAGYGVRGYANITASGVADWLTYLLPFTPVDIQIRAIGQKQGDVSAPVTDDDDWQVRFYVKDAADKEVGNTWLYGNPESIYFQSELLPDTLLSVPVEQVHLLYQLARGEVADLFFAFDPMKLLEPGANGNLSSYQALANVLDIPETEWQENWLPVLEKYLLHLDLWLTGYGDSAFLTGDSGKLTMAGTYTIPVSALKKEAKYLIGQMLYDNDLQALLIPHVTMEERITYLNPNMVYFYEACIDALPLQGDIVFSREMTSLGEIASTTIELPLPPLPEKLIAPIGRAASALLDLSYQDLLAGMNRISYTRQGSQISLTLSGTKRTIEISGTDTATDDHSVELTGSLRITPNLGEEESYLSAAFTCSASHSIWQDSKYNDRDTTSFAVALTPDFSSVAEDHPLRQLYADFSPLSFEWRTDYRNDPYKDNSPVQVNIDMSAKLPDAEVSADVVLRVATNQTMTTLSTEAPESILEMPDVRKTELLEAFLQNAILTMAHLNPTLPAEETQPSSAPAATE